MCNFASTSKDAALMNKPIVRLLPRAYGCGPYGRMAERSKATCKRVFGGSIPSPSAKGNGYQDSCAGTDNRWATMGSKNHG